MRITILGSAAGGGFPQWNCHCPRCAGLRSGSLRARPRTQSSIFVQAQEAVDGLLLNASPDLLQQIRSNPQLHASRAQRDSAIAAVLLVDGQVDHCTGLFMLRERGTPLPLWCTAPVAQDLSEGNPVLRVLSHYCGVELHEIVPDGREFSLAPPLQALRIRAHAVAGKAAPYSPNRQHGLPGDNIALTLHEGGGRLFYAPGLAEITPDLFDAMCAADLVLVDGTFWSEHEMRELGLSRASAREMGHLPQSGPGGMLAHLSRLPARTRRMLIHINNSNPILDEDSLERAQLRAAGVEVAEDGMQISL
ncbi:pyrroloquinoline quinone biosynthesis protein B [Paucibacter oligotrophus]|uniref:Coenzyme PQQ synthesis protein B n=1 Tax=Roseateles oligotrophus TaxID=1769250 RepID=A0A840L2I1_9BURK|nr:pyrroloquinoline quinone biosynthesis protein PqqB [Roseateles oligotrophus]MBB4842450.1 pyrroloquinoline quinone biosynthesis protein B [Roseateles oligotrophus]